jgi:multidrug/hemolysin transport system permease protein
MFLLYFLVLGQNIINGVSVNIPIDQITFLVDSDILGGVLIISIIGTVSGGLNSFVMDQYESKLQGILVSPVSRVKIILGYVIAAVLSSFLITLILWVFIYLYIGISTSHFFSFGTFVIVPLILFLYTIITSMILLFPMSLFTTPSASSPFTGIVGTLVGFTCGIYMPLSLFSPSMNSVAGLIPFTHMQVILKRVMITDSLELMNIPKENLEELWKTLGANEINILGLDLNPFMKIIYSFVIALIFLFLSVLVISKKIKK